MRKHLLKWWDLRWTKMSLLIMSPQVEQNEKIFIEVVRPPVGKDVFINPVTLSIFSQNLRSTGRRDHTLLLWFQMTFSNSKGRLTLMLWFQIKLYNKSPCRGDVWRPLLEPIKRHDYLFCNSTILWTSRVEYDHTLRTTPRDEHDHTLKDVWRVTYSNRYGT